MSIPITERTVELQFTEKHDVDDDKLDDCIAFLLADIISKFSAEEIENLKNE